MKLYLNKNLKKRINNMTERIKPEYTKEEYEAIIKGFIIFLVGFLHKGKIETELKQSSLPVLLEFIATYLIENDKNIVENADITANYITKMAAYYKELIYKN
jgi:hypothetical protein